MTDAVLFACALRTDVGNVVLRSDASIVAALRAQEPAWVHLAADAPGLRKWIATWLGYLDPHVLTALLADETRPRAMPLNDGLMLILRGVNLNDGEEPEDMVSVRMWLEPARIVTVARRRLASLDDMRIGLESGRGPTRAGAFLCDVVDHLGNRIETFLRDLDEEVDALEENVMTDHSADLRSRITETRRRIVSFRRHIAPQRDALSLLAQANVRMLDETDHRRLFEAHDRLVRTVEELDAMRERLQVVKDELQAALADRLNRNLFVLSVISAIFLPLGFLTGLMGINVAGIPGADWPMAFWTFCSGLAIVLALQLLILRLIRWI
ncbi:MAG: zinc transporter ZntB [Rhodobacteraceae bacterium]|nr:zinc transporter ZntB [Paracoccaceae bacterium]